MRKVVREAKFLFLLFLVCTTVAKDSNKMEDLLIDDDLDQAFFDDSNQFQQQQQQSFFLPKQQIPNSQKEPDNKANLKLKLEQMEKQKLKQQKENEILAQKLATQSKNNFSEFQEYNDVISQEQAYMAEMRNEKSQQNGKTPISKEEREALQKHQRSNQNPGNQEIQTQTEEEQEEIVQIQKNFVQKNQNVEKRRQELVQQQIQAQRQKQERIQNELKNGANQKNSNQYQKQQQPHNDRSRAENQRENHNTNIQRRKMSSDQTQDDSEFIQVRPENRKVVKKVAQSRNQNNDDEYQNDYSDAQYFQNDEEDETGYNQKQRRQTQVQNKNRNQRRDQNPQNRSPQTQQNRKQNIKNQQPKDQEQVIYQRGINLINISDEKKKQIIKNAQQLSHQKSEYEVFDETIQQQEELQNRLLKAQNNPNLDSSLPIDDEIEVVEMEKEFVQKLQQENQKRENVIEHQKNFQSKKEQSIRLQMEQVQQNMEEKKRQQELQYKRQMKILKMKRQKEIERQQSQQQEQKIESEEEQNERLKIEQESRIQEEQRQQQQQEIKRIQEIQREKQKVQENLKLQKKLEEESQQEMKMKKIQKKKYEEMYKESEQEQQQMEQMLQKQIDEEQQLLKKRKIDQDSQPEDFAQEYDKQMKWQDALFQAKTKQELDLQQIQGFQQEEKLFGADIHPSNQTQQNNLQSETSNLESDDDDDDDNDNIFDVSDSDDEQDSEDGQADIFTQTTQNPNKIKDETKIQKENAKQNLQSLGKQNEKNLNAAAQIPNQEFDQSNDGQAVMTLLQQNKQKRNDSFEELEKELLDDKDDDDTNDQLNDLLANEKSLIKKVKSPVQEKVQKNVIQNSQPIQIDEIGLDLQTDDEADDNAKQLQDALQNEETLIKKIQNPIKQNPENLQSAQPLSDKANPDNQEDQDDLFKEFDEEIDQDLGDNLQIDVNLDDEDDQLDLNSQPQSNQPIEENIDSIKDQMEDDLKDLDKQLNEFQTDSNEKASQDENSDNLVNEDVDKSTVNDQDDIINDLLADDDDVIIDDDSDLDNQISKLNQSHQVIRNSQNNNVKDLNGGNGLGTQTSIELDEDDLLKDDELFAYDENQLIEENEQLENFQIPLDQDTVEAEMSDQKKLDEERFQIEQEKSAQWETRKQDEGPAEEVILAEEDLYPVNSNADEEKQFELNRQLNKTKELERREIQKLLIEDENFGRKVGQVKLVEKALSELFIVKGPEFQDLVAEEQNAEEGSMNQVINEATMEAQENLPKRRDKNAPPVVFKVQKSSKSKDLHRPPQNVEDLPQFISFMEGSSSGIIKQQHWPGINSGNSLATTGIPSSTEQATQNKQIFQQLLLELSTKKVDQDISEIALKCKEHSIYSKAIKLICEMCIAQFAYEISEETWFKIGIANGHKRQFSELLADLTQLLPGARLFVSFAKNGEVCLAAEQFENDLDIQKVLKSISGHELSQFETQPQLFDFEAHSNAVKFDLFKLRVSFKAQDSNSNIKQVHRQYLEFEAIISGSWTAELTEKMVVEVASVVFILEKRTVLYFGTLAKESFISSVHFSHDIDTRQASLLDIFVNLPVQSYSIETLCVQLFGQVNSNDLLNTINISRGVSDMRKLRLEKLSFTFQLKNKFYRVIAQFKNLDSFAITPQINLVRCTSWVVLDDDNGNGKLNSLHITGKVLDFSDEVYAHVMKTPQVEKYIVNLMDHESSWEELDSFVLSRFLATPNPNYAQAFGTLFDFQNTYVHSVDMHIQFEPQLMYFVDGEVGVPGWSNIGNFEIVMTNVNQRMVAFAQMRFADENISHFYSRLPTGRLPEAIKSQSTYMFYSEYDIDLGKYHYLSKKGFGPSDQTVWQRGLFIRHVFDLSLSCGHSQICHLLHSHRKATLDLTVEGYYNQPELLLLEGQLEAITLSGKMKFHDIQMYLEVYNATKSYDRSPEIDFYLTGIYEIPIQNGQHLTLDGTLFYNEKHEGLLVTESYLSWEKAFQLENLNLNQISLKGHMNEHNYTLDRFSVSGLTVFGNDCYVEKEKSMDFLGDRCFYGNAKMRLNFKNPELSYLQGYYTDVNMLHILTNFLHYDPITLYEKVNKALIDLKFTNGLLISYAMSNIYETKHIIEFGDEEDLLSANTENEFTREFEMGNLKEHLQKVLAIPAGITISAQTEFMSLKGSLILNIHDNQLLGIFHFATVSLAGGNIFLFEQNQDNSNNIIFKLDSQSGEDKVAQVAFTSNATIFNVHREITFHISDITGIEAEFEEKLFGSNHVLPSQVSAPFSGSITTAPFTLNIEFTESHFKSIENRIQELTIAWMTQINNLIDVLSQELSHIEQILVNKKKHLCHPDQCPEETECIAAPKKQCVHYRQKQICELEEVFCLDIEEVCVKSVEQCLHHDDVCIEYHGIMGACSLYEKQCTDQYSYCSEWKSQCAGEKVQTCALYRFVDDVDQCLQYTFACETTSIQDQTCIQECQNRIQSFDYYSDLYSTLEDAKERFLRKIAHFNALSIEVFNDPQGFLSILGASVSQSLLSPVASQGLSVEFKILSFGGISQLTEIKAFVIDNYNFGNEELMTHNLFLLLLQDWAQTYSFDQLIIESEEGEIINSIFEMSQDQIKRQNAFNEQDANDFLKIQAIQKRHQTILARNKINQISNIFIQQTSFSTSSIKELMARSNQNRISQ